MDVKKIFMMLITIVACVVLGAFLLNTLLPNVVAGVSNAAEDMIFNATGIGMDFNGDGEMGNAAGNGQATYTTTNQQNASEVSGNVQGFGGNQQ